MKQGTKLDSTLRAWLDRVIVPALVKEYLVEMRVEKEFASDFESDLQSVIRADRSPP